MTNLTVNVRAQNLRVVERYDRRPVRDNWGCKTEGIKPGDFVVGIFMGWEPIDVKEHVRNCPIIYNIHTLQEMLIWGCHTIYAEMFKTQEKREFFNPRYLVGDVLKFTFKKSYVSTKAGLEGKIIGVFQVDLMRGYSINAEEIDFVKSYLQRREEQIKVEVAMRNGTYVEPKRSIADNPFQAAMNNNKPLAAKEDVIDVTDARVVEIKENNRSHFSSTAKTNSFSATQESSQRKNLFGSTSSLKSNLDI